MRVLVGARGRLSCSGSMWAVRHATVQGTGLRSGHRCRTAGAPMPHATCMGLSLPGGWPISLQAACVSALAFTAGEGGRVGVCGHWGMRRVLGRLQPGG